MLSDDEKKLFNRLRSNIDRKRRRNLLRTRLYDAHQTIEHFGISVPENMREFATVIGWPAKSVDTPARRIRPDGFTNRTESDLFDEVTAELANPRAMAIEKLAIQASLKHSCAFVFTSRAPEGGALLTAASALDASAILDKRTGQVMAALERLDSGWALYLPGKTMRVERTKQGDVEIVENVEHGHQRVTCTTYTWGRTIDRPFGRSRITRPLIGLTDIGVRVLLRQEVSAEFYSTPQRWALGVRPEDFQVLKGAANAWQAVIGGLFALPDIPIEDEQSEKLRRAEVGQFPQMTMQPHSDHLRTIAMMVSAETSLPLNYLGVVQDNPPSAEAIKATEADLVQIVEDELDWFRDSRSNLARDVAAVLHDEWTEPMAKDLKGLRAEFRDPSTPTKSAEGDWAVKMVGAFPWLAESETMLRLIFSDTVAAQLMNERRRNAAPGVLDRILGNRADPPRN